MGEHEKHTHKGTFFVFEGRGMWRGEGNGNEYKKHAQMGMFFVLWEGEWANTKNMLIERVFRV